MAMLAEEGEFPLGLGPVRRSGGIAKVAQRPDHLGDATGIVTEDLAVLLEPARRHGMVGRGLQMFASMPEVDHLGFGRQGLQEGPVVGGAIGDSDDPLQYTVARPESSRVAPARFHQLDGAGGGTRTRTP